MRNSILKIKINKHIVLLLIASVPLIAIAAQLAYPRDRNLPFAELFGQSVGLQKTYQTRIKIDKNFEDTKVNIKLSDTDKSTSLSLRNLGASNHSELMIDKLSYYPISQRLIPFSILFKKPTVSSFDIYFSEEFRQQAVEKLIPNLSSPAHNAKLYIKNQQVKIDPDQSGVTADPDNIISRLNSAAYDQNETQITIQPTEVKPKVTQEDLSDSYNKAVSYSQHKITVIGRNNIEYVISPEDIISMLNVVKESGQTTIKIDEKKLKKHIENAGNEFYLAPKPTTVKLVDGQEKSRKSGKDGETIDATDLQSQIQLALDSEFLEARIQTIPVPVEPSLIYDRSYTKSQKGLQAFIDYTTSTEDMRISIRQFDGNKWQASSRDSESMVSASTYKLFIAYMVLEKVDNGELSLSDKILDTDISGCLERMIVISENTCSEAWINEFGNQNINDYIHGKGVSSATTFTDPTATHTSAKDLMFMLNGIQKGSLLKPASNSLLRDKMARQIWRSGIPSGSQGSVRDKVGYIWSYTHDAAIVDHPNGKYAMVIMTNGSSFDRIAQLTREIENLMY